MVLWLFFVSKCACFCYITQNISKGWKRRLCFLGFSSFSMCFVGSKRVCFNLFFLYLTTSLSTFAKSLIAVTWLLQFHTQWGLNVRFNYSADILSQSEPFSQLCIILNHVLHSRGTRAKVKENSDLNDSWFQLLHRCRLFGLHTGTHHLPLHHTVLVQGFLVLMENALLVTLTEILQKHTTALLVI